MWWLVQSVTRVLQTLEFYIRLFFLKLDALLPLAITNMFPIVTLTSFETMSEPRSAVLISSCFSQNSNITAIIVFPSLTLNLGPEASCGPSGLPPNKADEAVDTIEPISQPADQTYNVDCQSEHSYRLIFLPLCQSNALFSWLSL